MAFIGRRVRPLFTLVIVVIGAMAGNALAGWYFKFLTRYLKGESPSWLLIPQNPTQLTVSDRLWLRVFFVVVGAMLGFVMERLAFQQTRRARSKWDMMSPHDRISFFAGIMLGLLLTVLLRNVLPFPDWVTAAIAIILCYVSVTALESFKEQLRFYFPQSASAVSGDRVCLSRPKILDTNVIIDGRIADICRAGFVEGPILVPKFVLEELQQIADSSDSLKRARGRRGLDILNQMQKEMDLEVPEFTSGESTEEVDSRLVLVAREVGGAIITNDYNLNRVAELQGVDVLNINELANAVKPVVLPGEEMRVTIIKEGKEKDQGIGYLDDGTMIVVEGARRLIGETLDVSVTSVLQTVQGKMIFAKIKENGDTGSSISEDSVRSYTGGRPRRKTR
jgi:uncharacterized protein YacL